MTATASDPTGSRPMLVEIDFRVKTYDVDFAGIVSNLVYVRWLEDLRIKMLDEYLPLEPEFRQGRGPVLARTEIDYLRPLRFGDQAVGRMWLAGVRRASWSLQAEFTLHAQLVARAVQVGVFVDYRTLKALPVPDALRQQMANGSPLGKR
jgi:acyl-CoA thioester hydrolase